MLEEPSPQPPEKKCPTGHLPEERPRGLNLHFQREQIKEYMAVLVLGMLFGLLFS